MEPATPTETSAPSPTARLSIKPSEAPFTMRLPTLFMLPPETRAVVVLPIRFSEEAAPTEVAPEAAAAPERDRIVALSSAETLTALLPPALSVRFAWRISAAVVFTIWDVATEP